MREHRRAGAVVFIAGRFCAMKKDRHPAGSAVWDFWERAVSGRYEADGRVRMFLTPARVLWTTDSPEAEVENAPALLRRRDPQVSLERQEPCVLKNSGAHAAVLLDFGIEVYGGVQLFIGGGEHPAETGRIRLRFGESAMEAMSEPGEHNSGNYHSLRDFAVPVPHLGTYESNCTGFRFVRIDLLDEDSFLEIQSIRAFAFWKDIPYVGDFRCDDERLNRIWRVGAYTVHLNMQQGYIWDGIKRDRLVWSGDIFTEIRTIEAVFGMDDSIARSLDFVRDRTPLPGWMNQMPTYSMWWILSQVSFYRYHGDIGYLRQQAGYLRGLARQLAESIAPDGHSATPPTHFIDWETLDDREATDAGIQALHTMALSAAGRLFRILDDGESASRCEAALAGLSAYRPACPARKPEAALMALAGLSEPEATNREVLAVAGAKGVSPFMGYFILKARAMAGDFEGCLDCIRDFWGGMLDLGATTFWESFDLEWMKQAARIDEIPPKGRVDVHGSYGDYCYKGYRKSLCHGWASGPTAWLSEYVLGVRILEPGCRAVRIEPRLGNLAYAEGTFPTLWGPIRIRHSRRADGSVKSAVAAPRKVRIVRG